MRYLFVALLMGMVGTGEAGEITQGPYPAEGNKLTYYRMIPMPAYVELVEAGREIEPYLENRVPSVVTCSGQGPYFSDNCILVVPGKDAAIRRLKEALRVFTFR